MEPITDPGQLNADTWDFCDHWLTFVYRFAQVGDIPALSARKSRLLMAAGLGVVSHHLTDPRSKAAADAAGRFDTEPDLDVLEAVAVPAAEAVNDYVPFIYGDESRERAFYLARAAALTVGRNGYGGRPVNWPDVFTELSASGLPEIQQFACHLIRDLIPNPFRPAAFDPAWRSSTVVGLAEAIYAERAWDRMPILADALEEAGCTDPQVLAHCRGPGPHARGCWVVDAILGKA